MVFINEKHGETVNKDTIVARATPSGHGSVGILRVSGPCTHKVAMKILGKIPRERYADYLKFKDNKNRTIDQGIAIWFSKPCSFTGEDVLELHGHGGPVVLDLLLKNILRLPGLRIAGPGEFSRRAFFNKKIDLVQAEAVIDLINADSEKTARAAAESLQGVFSKHVKNFLKYLISIRTNIEAILNFPEDVSNTRSNFEKEIKYLIEKLKKVSESATHGSLLREGTKIGIFGAPNVGKSSLFNILVEHEAAIVTDIAGTTRDVLHEYIHVDGVPIHLIDTAGLRNAKDKIEQIGIQRTEKQLKESNHILYVVDATKVTVTDKFLKKIKLQLPSKTPFTIIRNKLDLTDESYGLKKLNDHSFFCVSSLTGKGINTLRKHLNNISGFSNIKTEGLILARRRHLHALKKAVVHLNHCMHFSKIGKIELLAEEMKLVQKNLEGITGSFTTNDLLDNIFSSFCIGK